MNPLFEKGGRYMIYSISVPEAEGEIMSSKLTEFQGRNRPETSSEATLLLLLISSFPPSI